MEPKSFMVQCLAFFGLHPGQKPLEFAAECKQLTPEDRAELTQLLNAAGYPVKA